MFCQNFTLNIIQAKREVNSSTPTYSSTECIAIHLCACWTLKITFWSRFFCGLAYRYHSIFIPDVQFSGHMLCFSTYKLNPMQSELNSKNIIMLIHLNRSQISILYTYKYSFFKKYTDSGWHMNMILWCTDFAWQILDTISIFVMS